MPQLLRDAKTAALLRRDIDVLNDPSWRSERRYDPASPEYPQPPRGWPSHPTGKPGTRGFMVHQGTGLPLYPVEPGAIDVADTTFYKLNPTTGLLEPAFPPESELELHEFFTGDDDDDVLSADDEIDEELMDVSRIKELIHKMMGRKNG
jgi:hypothetical protein